MFTNVMFPIYIKESLYKSAVEKTLYEHGTTEIFPCGSKTEFDECFTNDENMVIFWYDVAIPNGMTTSITTKILN